MLVDDVHSSTPRSLGSRRPRKHGPPFWRPANRRAQPGQDCRTAILWAVSTATEKSARREPSPEWTSEPSCLGGSLGAYPLVGIFLDYHHIRKPPRQYRNRRK